MTGEWARGRRTLYTNSLKNQARNHPPRHYLAISPFGVLPGCKNSSVCGLFVPGGGAPATTKRTSAFCSLFWGSGACVVEPVKGV